MASSSSANLRLSKYDVFLSFRGQDVRSNFIDHLDAALRQKGIITFKDDRELQRGKAVIGEIEKAIEQSMFSIVVFSENYAASHWCLEELVMIHDRMKQESSSYRVFPVFYHVDPTHVQELTGSYGEAFAEHKREMGNDPLKVQKWKVATTTIAGAAGWDLQNKPEFKFIQGIVQEILSQVRHLSPRFSDDLEQIVKKDFYLEKMCSCLRLGQSDDIRIVGICGMAGIGKSTVARLVYSRLKYQFEGCSFLEKVREVEEKHGLVRLQKQLVGEILKDRKTEIWNANGGREEIKNRLSTKRVLVILDDVDRLEQLEFLAGRRSWFGGGSRIIITTRNEKLFLLEDKVKTGKGFCYEVDEIYKVDDLNHEEALQLFCTRAFGNGCPTEAYMNLSKQFVRYANRLPLALNVLGKHVRGRSIKEWESVLEKVKKIPDREIMDSLQISFEGLDLEEKSIFLDIACFFSGEHIDLVREVLESCGYHLDIGLRVLVEKFLITISNDIIWMHVLLQQMGREIVQREHNEPGQSSRLWLYKDIHHVLMYDTGSDQIEGIVLNLKDEHAHPDKQLISKALLKMTNLRLLKLKNLQLSGGLEQLPKIRYLEWHGYHLNSLPSTFQPVELVSLYLPHSSITRLWKGTKSLQMLKVIDLSHSRNLVETPNFRWSSSLEKLNFEGCTRLTNIHPSIGVLRRLLSLNLKDCKNLEVLPDNICDLKSLKVLNLLGCHKLCKLPEQFGEITSLEILSIGGIAKRQLAWHSLPSKRQNPMNLMLPFLSTLHSLQRLHIVDCNLKEGAIPYDLGCLSMLQELWLSGNHFESLPASVCRLSKLKVLISANCKRLQSLPVLPSSIEEFYLQGCTSLEVLPPMGQLPKLGYVNLSNCKRLKSMPAVSSSIKTLQMEGCTSLEDFPNPSGMCCPEKWHLDFINCPKLDGFKVAFTWLKHYLHFLLQSSRRVSLSTLLSDTSAWLMSEYFSMCITGGTIPSWFEYQGVPSSLKVDLPPNWCNDKWLGLCVCAVIKFPVLLSPSSHFSFASGLYACTMEGQLAFLGDCYADFLTEHCGSSRQICFMFIPRDNSRSNGWWNTFSHLVFDLASDPYPQFHLELEYCGLRLVYEENIEEISPRYVLTERLSSTCNNNVRKRKRNHFENEEGPVRTGDFLKLVFCVDDDDDSDNSDDKDNFIVVDDDDDDDNNDDNEDDDFDSGRFLLGLEGLRSPR